MHPLLSAEDLTPEALEAAQRFADQHDLTLDQAVSELILAGLPLAFRPKTRNGFPLLPRAANPIDLTHVRQAEDES